MYLLRVLTKIKSCNHFLRLCSTGSNLPRNTHKVNKLEKRFLVWTGKYKTLEEVPDRVGQGVLERARNKMRIRIANYMILATAVACVVMIISGKQAAKRGETVQQAAVDWHNKFNEQSKDVK